MAQDMFITDAGEVPFKAPIAGVTPTAPEHLATKAYVDASGGGGGVTAHSALTGLAADDHPHYSKADGTRAFTGVVVGVDGTIPSHLTTKGYTDYADGVVLATVVAVAAATYQPLNQNLANLSTFLPSVADRIFYWVDTIGGMATTPLTAAGRTLLAASTAVAEADIINSKGADIASAGTTNLAAATGLFVHVTGTTTITALGTAAAGVVRVVRFAGALTLTHNATSLILPGGANIATAANDIATFVSEGSGNWRCVNYSTAAATPVARGGTGRATSTTAYGLLAAGTTATGAHQTLAAGANTTILVGGGASALPVWTTATGSGAPVRATSPVLTTPNIGTPSAGTLTNCTGLPTAGLVNSAVIYAKMQNVSATDKMLGRSTAGAGVVEEIACTAAGRALIDDADATAQRATLGLVIGTDVGLPQSERASAQFWDCDGAVGDWINVTSGAGAAATVNTTDHIGGSLHVCGEWGLGTGTTSTGYAAFYKQPFVGFGDGTAYEFEARITNGALSTSGEEFQLTIGFGDKFNATGQPEDGACFIYRRDADGDFWVAVTRSNFTETKTVTAVAPAGYSAMTIFKVEVNSAGTSVAFSINGSVVATHTTNIPTGSSRLTGMGMKLEKQNGTTARYAYVDWFRLKKTRTAAR